MAEANSGYVEPNAEDVHELWRWYDTAAGDSAVWPDGRERDRADTIRVLVMFRTAVYGEFRAIEHVRRLGSHDPDFQRMLEFWRRELPSWVSKTAWLDEEEFDSWLYQTFLPSVRGELDDQRARDIRELEEALRVTAQENGVLPTRDTLAAALYLAKVEAYGQPRSAQEAEEWRAEAASDVLLLGENLARAYFWGRDGKLRVGRHETARALRRSDPQPNSRGRRREASVGGAEEAERLGVPVGTGARPGDLRRLQDQTDAAELVERLASDSDEADRELMAAMRSVNEEGKRPSDAEIGRRLGRSGTAVRKRRKKLLARARRMDR